MIVGVGYPSLESYKALKTETKDDDVQVGARLHLETVKIKKTLVYSKEGEEGGGERETLFREYPWPFGARKLPHSGA